MGATLAGETPPEQGTASGANEAGVPPNPQQQESPSGSESPKEEAKPPPPSQGHVEPQIVSNEYPKVLRRRSKSGHFMSVLEDIQRLPEDSIYQEFNRLFIHAQGQIKEVAEKPCKDMANRLKDCLHRNRQQSCECFPAMEQYRQCVLRATQERLDDMGDTEPVMIPVVPPRAMPRPANPPQAQKQRSWWRFWTWFK